MPPRLSMTRSVAQRSAFLVVGVWLYCLLPGVVAHMGSTSDTNPISDRTITGLLLGTLALIVAATFARGPQSWSSALAASDLALAVTAPTFVFIATLLSGATAIGDTVTYLATIGMIAALWLRPVGALGLKLIGGLGSIVGVYSLLAGLLDPDLALYASRTGIVLPKDGLVAGLSPLAAGFDHPNTLGIVMALAWPFALLCRRRVISVALIAPMFAALAWSNSRSSVLTVAVALLYLIVRSATRAPKVLFGVTLIAITGVVIIAPWIVSDPEAISGRGAIWHAGLAAWQQAPVFGLGMDWFQSTVAASDFGGTSSGHNLFVSLVATGGLLYALVVLLTLVHIFRRVASRMGDDLSMPLEVWMVSFLALSCTEFVWTPLMASQVFPVSGLVCAMALTAHQAAAASGLGVELRPDATQVATTPR